MNNTLIGLSFLLVSTVFAQTKTVAQPTNNAYNTKTIEVFATAQNTNIQISKLPNLSFSKLLQPVESQVYVFVNPNKQFQQFVGIGGAITDASAEVFAKMGATQQQDFLNAYFDKNKGIGYSIIRTNINSCDFSSDMYTYVTEGDKQLSSFSVLHDEKYKIPLIKRAISTASGKVSVFASPWSPPAFMKSNNNMLQGGQLLPEYYQAWANYYVKFINSYQKLGVPVWGITIQNEPMARQKWESCIYTAQQERDFLKNYLGPTFAKAGLSSKKIIIWDHNRDLIAHRANTVLSDKNAAKYVWGIGFHWYESWSGSNEMYNNIERVKELYPNKNLIFTEGCAESFKPGKYHTWANGERYGKSMINDFNNGTVGWTDWNILLDEKGGPNHVGNFCFAPVHFDTKTSDLIFTPSYYYIGHFSKFIDKDARRISSVASRSQLLTTSFLNANGKIVTIVMNETDNGINYELCVGEYATKISILPHAIQTIIF
ncbi:MAG: glycoside hydrolase family 30 protein [Flavobacterium sp.]|nr:glycoside hydrolase family 30 protein [Flavobacterium sp.]